MVSSLLEEQIDLFDDEHIVPHQGLGSSCLVEDTCTREAAEDPLGSIHFAYAVNVLRLTDVGHDGQHCGGEAAGKMGRVEDCPQTEEVLEKSCLTLDILQILDSQHLDEHDALGVEY
jgi:hypothetical protein